MSFESLETSIEDGRPIYFYRFSLNDKTWRYTSADADITRSGDVWKAIPIADDGIRQTGESTTDALKITTTTRIPPSEIYMGYTPSRPVSIAIFIGHEGNDQIKAIYMGEISSANVVQPGTIEFTCETLSATMDRAGLRFVWQRGCIYALYDEVTCKVPKGDWGIAGTVSDVEGNIVTVPALGAQLDGRFGGGFVEWTDAVRGVERRTIEYNVAGELVMFGTADGLEVGTALIAYPGCARTTAACASFNNLPNYGGAPGMQGKSPFDGTPVFY